jgi:hypothetical protein
MLTPLYVVVSEILYETIPLLDDGSGPSEPYRIFEIVAARNASAARWAAYQTDHNAEPSPREMPRFATRKLGMTLRPPGLYTEDKQFWGRYAQKIFTLKAPDERDAEVAAQAQSSDCS